MFSKTFYWTNEDNERMVKTPWFEDPIPFKNAAKIGTEKVIKEHSTIGVVVTTDGSIVDIDREQYKDAEEEIINFYNIIFINHTFSNYKISL